MIRFSGLDMARDFAENVKEFFKTAQSYVDTQTIKYLEDYTPIAQSRFRNAGKMSKSHKTSEPGVIINTEPKARHEYYTNKGFSGANRGKLWLERMKADHKEDILKGLLKK